jgi:hypothetical protein
MLIVDFRFMIGQRVGWTLLLVPDKGFEASIRQSRAATLQLKTDD